jgi:hypothetical protein
MRVSKWQEVQAMLWITDESEIDLKSGLSTIYFYSHRDPFHFRVFNFLEDIEDEFPNIRFYAVEASSFPKLVKKYDVAFLPLVKVFKDEGRTARTLTKVEAILNRSIWADIDTRYQQGELRARRQRTKASHIQPEANSRTATSTGPVDIEEDLGPDSELRSSTILASEPTG